MLINRAVTSSVRCSQCRISVLSAFASAAGVSFGTLSPISPPIVTQRLLIPRRAFQASSAVRSELQPQENDVLDEAEHLEDKEVTNTVGESRETPQPWYLQVETPQRQISPLSERQQLPELPANPPALLQPLLEHISIDLGLDDLTLFDLRKLDPPAALGANLLMIIGSARSEKHLHVSADRLCRWLRTTHGLRPYADGLLGRNELKLKLRRKNRRAKLLGSVGSIDSKDRDDGIRTGWVCVNIGAIEESTEDVIEPEGFVGFGSRGTEVRVVVQMLTEEKREELDLESLWEGFLRRQAKKEAEDLRVREEYEQEEVVGRIPPANKRLVSDISCVATPSYLKSPRPTQTQSRGFHNSARSFDPGQNIHEQFDHTGPNPSGIEPRLQFPSNNKYGSVRNMEYSASLDQHTSNQSDRFSDVGDLLALRTHLNYLKSLPREDAIEVLGQGPVDHDSTSFLTSFYGSYPLFPSAEHWECRLDLHCYATEIRHRHYGTSNLFKQFKEMRASGAKISEATFVNIFRTMLLFRQPIAPNDPDATDADDPVRAISITSVMRAAYVLHDMSLSGLNIVTEEMFMMLLEAVMLARSYMPSSMAALQDLLRILLQHRPDITNSQSHYRILQMYASTYDWTGFWRYWRGIARQEQPRTADHYILMYCAVASTAHQAHCMQALRTWVSEMQIEEPPVELVGAVAEAVMECVRVAEPSIENAVAENWNEMGEWTRLWRRCLAGLEHTEA
ncbi:MAG: hypothetical protein LQ347_001779 [Umbilicaria vellea]|nr:MAG: hypothetical protein LQ347_001779 [Umbilicaria vellea]